MQKKLYCAISFILLLTFALVGCGAAKSNLAMDQEEGFGAYPAVMEYAEEKEAVLSAEEESIAMESPMDAGERYDDGVSYENEPVERIVLKNASLTIKVDDPAEVITTIAFMAERRGGFVINSNVYRSYYYQAEEDLPQGYITIRVPAEDLNSALEEIRGLTEDPKYDVSSESISGQDVTSQYTDLESRLRNLEEADAQMRTFMEEAENTEEVLMVYYQQKQISEEIEIIKGQLKYYEEASSLSSISIEVLPKFSAATVNTGGWELEGVFKRALQTLVNAFQFIVEALVWIVIVILPVLILISMPLILLLMVIKALVKRSKKRKNKKIVASNNGKDGK